MTPPAFHCVWCGRPFYSKEDTEHAAKHAGDDVLIKEEAVDLAEEDHEWDTSTREAVFFSIASSKKGPAVEELATVCVGADDDSLAFDCAWCGRQFCSDEDKEQHAVKHAEDDENDVVNKDTVDLADKDHDWVTSTRGSVFVSIASSEAISLYEDDLPSASGVPPGCSPAEADDQQTPVVPSGSDSAARDGRDKPRGDGVYRCKACGVSCASKAALMSHLRSHIRGDDFMCQVCDKRFTHAIELERHHRTHARDKLFECNVCHKRFTAQRSLTRHQARHNASDRLVCPVCNKSFSSTFSLKRHAKGHGGTSGQLMFQCHFCGQMFASKPDLLSHFKVHAS